MAITADDVTLEDIIPISLDFAVVEGEQLMFNLSNVVICRQALQSN